MSLRDTFRRLNQSAVFWSWVFNFLRLSAGVILLPLLLHKLSEPDLGMYYVFLMLVSLVPILDQAFSFNISRFVGFAMGGAKEIKPRGIELAARQREPNFKLVWNLLLGTRRLYLRIACGTVVFLGGFGWLMVGVRVDETADPQLTWFAAGLALAAAGVEIYSTWWNAFLRGLNRVRDAACISSVTYGVKLLLSCLFLLLDFGLASVPSAGLICAVLQRTLSRRQCLAILPSAARPKVPMSLSKLTETLWPTSWRVGLQLLSGYVAINGLSLLCLSYLGLEMNARFGISWQVIMLIQGMAAAFTGVAWPRVAQLRAHGDHAGIRQLLWPLIRNQLLSYLLLVIPFIFLGQPALELLSSGKQLLPQILLGLLALNVCLEMQFSFWTTLLATENRVPSLWATVVTNLACLGVAFYLLQICNAGVEAIVLAPLVCGCLFNYWFWPDFGARNVKTTWLKFTFGHGR